MPLNNESQNKQTGMGNMVPGIITVELVSASLTINTEMFGKMDPYVTVVYNTVSQPNKKTVKTKVHKSGGQTPQWNEKFEFLVESMDDNIIFTVFDKDMFFDDLVGNVIMKVGALVSKSVNAGGNDAPTTLDLFQKIEKTGDLNINISFESLLPAPKIEKQTTK